MAVPITPLLTDQDSHFQGGGAMQRIMWICIGIALCAIMLGNPYNKSSEQLLLACMIIVVTLLPLSAWLTKRGEPGIPFLAMHGIFYAACFGVAGFVTPDRFIGNIQVAEQDYTPALIATLLSWAVLCAGYHHASRWRRTIPLQTPHTNSNRTDLFALQILYPSSALAVLFTDQIGIAPITQAVIAVHTFAFVWILHASWSGRFSSSQRAIVLLLLMPIELLIFGGLSDGKLAGILIYGQTIGITYALTRGRIPTILAVLIVALFALLQPVKGEYREQTRNTLETEIGRLEGLNLYAKLAWDFYTDRTYGLAGNMVFDDWYSRINHLHTTTAVMAATPDQQPYLLGETLLPLVTKWIPRALWPEKPREDIGNTWAKEYGYLGDDDFVTSYNLPWLPEMYMNFGWLGVVVISYVVGLLMGLLKAWLMTGPLTSVQYAYALMLASSFFFPESNLSLQLGDLMIKGITVWLLLRLLSIDQTRRSRLGAET